MAMSSLKATWVTVLSLRREIRQDDRYKQEGIQGSEPRHLTQGLGGVQSTPFCTLPYSVYR